MLQFKTKIPKISTVTFKYLTYNSFCGLSFSLDCALFFNESGCTPSPQKPLRWYTSKKLWEPLFYTIPVSNFDIDRLYFSLMRLCVRKEATRPRGRMFLTNEFIHQPLKVNGISLKCPLNLSSRLHLLLNLRYNTFLRFKIFRYYFYLFFRFIEFI